MPRELAPGGVKFFLVEARCDWAQYSSGFGFPYPNQPRYCFKCNCPKAQAFAFERAAEWRETTSTVYAQELARCISAVEVSKLDCQSIFDNLQWDRRQNGMHGRVLQRDVVVTNGRTGAAITLCKWDRLEVGGSVNDLYVEPICLPDPCVLTFFRRQQDVPFQFISPLMRSPDFKIEYVMVPRILCSQPKPHLCYVCRTSCHAHCRAQVDIMHTLDLGVAAKLLGEAIVRLLKCGVAFGTPKTKHGEDRALAKFNRELQVYYCEKQKELRAHSLNLISTVSKVTWKVLLLSGRPHLRLRAAETRHMVPFVLQLLAVPATEAAVLQGVALKSSIEHLQIAYEMLKSCGPEMDAAARSSVRRSTLAS